MYFNYKQNQNKIKLEVMMICCTLIDWPNSLKTVPNGVANCRNLPFGRRETQGSQVRLPREENERSRHQRLFEENFRKTKKTKVCGFGK